MVLVNFWVIRNFKFCNVFFFRIFYISGFRRVGRCCFLVSCFLLYRVVFRFVSSIVFFGDKVLFVFFVLVGNKLFFEFYFL